MDPNQFNLFYQNQNKSIDNNITPTSGSALSANGLPLTADQVNQQNLNYVYNQRVNLNNLPTQEGFNSLHGNSLRMNQLPFNTFQQQMPFQQPVQLSAPNQPALQTDFNGNQLLYAQRPQIYPQIAPQPTMVPTDNQLGLSQTNQNQNLQFGNVTSMNQNPLESQNLSQFPDVATGIQKNPQLHQAPQLVQHQQPQQPQPPQQPTQANIAPAQPNLQNVASNSQQPGSTTNQTPQPGQPTQLPPITSQQLKQLSMRIADMRNKGSTEENDPEYAKLVNFTRAIVQRIKASQTTQAVANLNHVNTENKPNFQTNYPPIQPAPTTPASLGTDQIKTVKDQISSFRLMSRNLPLTPNLQQTLQQPIAVHNATTTNVTQAPTLSEKIDMASQNYVAKEQSEVEQQSQSSDGKSQSFVSPYTLLNGPNAKKQHLIVPSITPGGIDPYTISREREERIKIRIQERIKELENTPSNLSNYSIEDPVVNDQNNDQDLKSNHAPKLKAIIELKSLRLLILQKKVRDDIIKCMNQSNTLTANLDRSCYRRTKRQNIREARNTEKLERQQRAERERKEKQKHMDFLSSILQHGRDLQQWHRNLQTRQSKLGKFVTNFHQAAEKEEQKRIERLQRHRIELLKTGNEAEYMKLVDKAKDSRLTHLLQETNNFLKALSNSVREQQQHVASFNISNTSGENISKIDFDLDADDDNADYYAIAHRVQESITAQPSILQGGKLKDYQIKGLEWMVSLFNNHLNGILADEMGLGKTIQTISLVTHLIDVKKINGPYLIIVPLSTIPNWSNEFEKWAPSVRKVVYKGDPAHRRSLQFNELRHENFQVLLTTFEYIIKDKKDLSRFKWVHTIIDEGHRMKNASSKLTITLNQFYNSRNRLILTGTPLQNNLPELWALLNFILPKVFNSVSTFEEWFNTPFSTQGGQEKIALNEEEQLLIIKRLHKVLRPFLLRRLKKDVESELPQKIEHVVRCKMSALQSRLYNQMKLHKNLFNHTNAKGKTRITGLNNRLMQLRKICNHPYVFQEVENAVNPFKYNDDKLYRVSGKFELLDRILPKLFEFEHRCLIFFQMTQVMTIMEDFLTYRGIRCLRLDGTTKHDDRSRMLKDFNDPNSEYKVFLLSTRAGGLGLNLQTADTVIIFDSDWNPHQDLQAQDRAHRIGQKREVRIFRLITANSVEEQILERAQYKLDMDGKVIQAGKFDNKSTESERESILRHLLGLDGEETGEAEDEDFSDELLNDIISRNDAEKQKFAQMDRERIDREQHNWKLKGGKGPAPERLVQDHELPEIYLQEHNSEDASTPVEEMGRGQRIRERIYYDDGLTEEQYAEAVDSGTLSEVIEKSRIKQLKREARRGKKAMSGSSKEPSPSIASPTATETPGSQSTRGRPKRKRPVEDTVDTPNTPPAQARAHRPGSANSLPAHIRRQFHQIFTDIYNALDECVDSEDGNRPRSEIFLELPDEHMYPDYYEIIKKAIAMDMIKKRIDRNYYKDIQTFRSDWILMFDNARTYNEVGSTVYEDANALQSLLDTKLDEFCPNGQLPELDPSELPAPKKRGRKPQPKPIHSPALDSIRSSPSAVSTDPPSHHRPNKRVLSDDDSDSD